ncbi:hypothetical protein F0562_029156 [Nyssa sinensis]|uniref:Peptidase S59 domain-containing protein n=1 Tax=Nyssa sinensis TaxID=561372 RepID=A0A5J5B233_9ASTE|nr:hypothetical protein F0562_029156 [Nyssa sinensis]
MFGSTTPFVQPNGSPFGSPSVFEQTSNPSSNLFTPKPFGSTTPFGSAAGGSIFGGTSTGVFGATSSPSASTSLYGASSSPTFGSSAPSFGSSMLGQNPAFGGFGSSTNQSNTFGSTFQQTQSTFGSSVFGSSTPFGASSQPAFGASSAPAFGTTSTAAFGAVSTPAFGRTSTAFGVSTAPVFGSAGAFGASSTPAFGASSTMAFRASTSPAYGIPNSPAFSASSTPGPSFGSTPTFGQSTSTAGSGSLFGTTPSPSGTQTSPFGGQITTQTFGPSAFGGQRRGSRVIAYTTTAVVDGGSSTQPAGKLVSISAMPVYREKNLEELRWEDYELADKGGCSLAGQSAGGIGFSPSTTQSNPFSPSPAPGQQSMNPFSSSTNSNPFSFPTPNFSSSGSGASSTPSFSSTPFSTSSFANPFGTTSSLTPSKFAPASAPALGPNSSSSLFATSSPPTFASSPSIFTSTSAPATASVFSSGFSFSNTQSPPLFQPASSLGQTHAAVRQISSSFGPSTAPSFSQTNMFSAPSTGSGFGVNLFSSTPSLLSMSNPAGFNQTMPSFPTPFMPAQTPQTAGALSSSTFAQSSAAGSSGIEGVTRALGQTISSQPSAIQSTVSVQPSPVMSPFGTLPAVPRMSIGSTPSIQYGISSMPVSDKPTSVRISSLLTTRHLPQRQIRFPTRKYDPRTDGSKVPFFSDDKTPSTPKADALFPRENPRALVIRPMEQWPKRANTEKMSPLVCESFQVHENGNISGVVSSSVLNSSVHQDKDGENGTGEGCTISANPNLKPNQMCDYSSIQRADLHVIVPGHKVGEAARVHEHGLDVEALMPKLRRTDYYTKPQIQELAVKERAEPGFCCCVKDFVVGRHGYGSIKFLGETDVRQLDLESHVQFNNREVIVYMDECKKPPVGQGLNKPAEVTLLNIKCFDKKTRKQYIDGPKVDKYREMLIKKATNQGVEFVSYNPVEGEWKFRVQHFSRYEFRDDEDFGSLMI